MRFMAALGQCENLSEGNLAKQVAKQTYFQSVQVAKEVLTDMRMGRAVNLRRVKRAVQSIVASVWSCCGIAEGRS